LLDIFHLAKKFEITKIIKNSAWTCAPIIQNTIVQHVEKKVRKFKMKRSLYRLNKGCPQNYRVPKKIGKQKKSITI
jgi:hypothetical protein